MSYLVHEISAGVHVYPDSDSQKHTMSLLCSCNPSMRVNEGVSIIRHYPFDGRIDTEEEKRQLGE